MANLVNFEARKTYATRENAVKAVEKLYADKSLRYFVMTSEDGRFFPVFIGEAAVQAGVHFNFHVVG